MGLRLRRISLQGAIAIAALLLVSAFISSASAATYYVNSTGNDANPGTVTQPWRTIQHAVDSVGPGDTIYVRGGTYNEWVSISTSGLPGQPITLQGYPNETAILEGNGLEWRYGIDINDSDYWTIQNLVVEDYIRDGLRGFGFVSWYGSTGITLRNLEFSLVGTPIKFHMGGEDILIEDIYAHDYDFGGFDCGPAGPCANLTIRRFTALGPGVGDDTGVDGFAVEKGENILVEDCVAEGHPGDGFDFKSNTTILRRVISRNNARNNIKLWGLGSKLENCLSYDSGLTNLVLAEGGSYVVTNCLFANCKSYGYLVTVGYGQSLDTPLRLQNTIFYNDNPAMGGTTLYFGAGVNLTADHNLYYNPYREDAVICVAFLGYQCFSNKEINDGTWFAASGCGEHSLYANPQFVDAALRDYHLTSESPGVDNGTAVDAPSEDLEGNARPQGGGYDIGPYEYAETQRIAVTSPEKMIYPSTCVRLNFVVEPGGTVLEWIGYSLDGGANVTIAGNTTLGELSAGMHTVMVHARDRNGTTASSAIVTFTNHPGDITGDNIVNIFDLQRLAWAFMSQPGDANWNSAADLNCDNVVNIFDLQILAWNFMNHY
jgi:hypothetical protein